MNFMEVFNKNYSYFLHEINYRVITVGAIKDKVDISVRDYLDFSMLDKSHLQIIVKRKVEFQPNLVYELSVSFGAVLELINEHEHADNFDWEKEFKNSAEGLSVIQGLLTRVSLQIAQITSSYGLNPVVTPPNLLN